MKDSQHYSKIAKTYLESIKYDKVCYGNLDDMESLFILFGGDRDKELKKSTSWNNYIYRKFKFVLDKLDRESKKPDAIFEKRFIRYSGIIKTPTRCFILKEN